MDMLFKMRPRIGLSHVVKLVNHIAGFVYSLIFPDDGEVCFGKIAAFSQVIDHQSYFCHTLISTYFR